MYHDEFARPTTETVPYGEDALPTFALELGGGLSLGLMASLNLTVSMVFFFIGGLLPLLTCCGSIAAHRWSETLAGATMGRPAAVPLNVPRHHLAARSGSPRRSIALRERPIEL